MCEPGYFLQENQCEKCPVGSYQSDKDFSGPNCTPCCCKTTTLSAGSTSIESCNVSFTCPPGYFYDSTYEFRGGCNSCSIGYYQPQDNYSGACIACPLGSTTISYSSVSLTDCLPTSTRGSDSTSSSSLITTTSTSVTTFPTYAIVSIVILAFAFLASCSFWLFRRRKSILYQ